MKQQRRQTQIFKSSIYCNLGRLRYCTQSVQRVLIPGTCSSRRLRFWPRCWDNIVKFSSQVGAYTKTLVCDILRLFAKKNSRCISKSILYFNTVLFLISSFTIWIIQIFQSYLFHDLIGTYYLDLIIFNYSYLHYWNMIPQYQLSIRKYLVLTYNLILQSKVDR